MKITKSQLIKIIKEEIIQELGFERGFSPALKQITSELEQMIVSRLGGENVTVDIDEWGPTEYDEPAGGEIRVSWEVGAIDAGSIMADESDLERSTNDYLDTPEYIAAAKQGELYARTNKDEENPPDDLRARLAPAVEHEGIGEGEGRVAGHGDALPQRRFAKD